MIEAVELRLPPDTQHVALARLVVVSAARRAGMDEERVQDLRIAVSEATTNAILARKRAASPERVTVRFGETAERQFEVTVAGTDPEFRLASEDAVGAEHFSDDGQLGVTIIGGLTDRVEFVRDADRTSLRFAISFDAASDIEADLGD